MNNTIDISKHLTGLLSLRASLDEVDFEPPPSGRQELEEWNDRLDETSPWSSSLESLAGLVSTAPAEADPYVIGLLQGVLDARGGATRQVVTSADQNYRRGYEEGAASVSAKAKPAPTLRLVSG